MCTTIGLILLWSFPVSFTAVVSQIIYLAPALRWLSWIDKIPEWLLGVIQGAFPQILLAIFLVLFPVVLRRLICQDVNYTVIDVELSLQKYYFVFLFVQIFLVASISAGLTTIAKELGKDIKSVPTLLANNLPKASDYFFSYLLSNGFIVSAATLLQVGSFVKIFILSPLYDETARQKWERRSNLPQMQWGTYFPVFTNLACIGTYIWLILSMLNLNYI
jgi:hypothetical protein